MKTISPQNNPFHTCVPSVAWDVIASHVGAAGSFSILHASTRVAIVLEGLTRSAPKVRISYFRF